MTEQQLIEGCINNDRVSQKNLYDKYSGQMYSICLRYCHDPASAADALQMGFIKVFQNVERINDFASLGGWIRKIIIRSAIDEIKKKKALFYDDIENINENNFSYTIDFDFDDFTVSQLKKLIDQLPEGYKLVFSMFVLDDMTHKEIGDTLNISESTSRSQLFRARNMMQDFLSNKSLAEFQSPIFK